MDAAILCWGRNIIYSSVLSEAEVEIHVKLWISLHRLANSPTTTAVLRFPAAAVVDLRFPP